MSDNNDAIEQACKSFQKSVDSLIQKIRKRKQKRGTHDKEADASLENVCQRLVCHGNHIFCTLMAKRTSLENALKAFREATERYVEEFAALNEGGANVDDQRKQILRKWFAIYVRLRDGFVLLESGERRHPHDGDDVHGVDVSRSEFPSELSGAYRRDGVTRKFSSQKGYSGAGWDEFDDEDVGIKQRLSEALWNLNRGGKRRSREELWERLEESGAGTLYTQIGFIRDACVGGRLRDDLKDAEQYFEGGVNEHLKSIGRQRMELVRDDKSERITLGKLDIARQGNAFTIADAGGSLPFGMTLQDWRKRFGLVVEEPQKVERAKNKRKRRVILEDSSSEEDEDKTTSYKKAAPAKKQPQPQEAVNDNDDGLAVRVREGTDLSKGNTQTTSLDEMKRNLGVNNAQLEQGREQLEEEQLQSKMAADDEDMKAELMGDGNGGNNDSPHVLLVKKILSSRLDLRNNEYYKKDSELIRESQEYWEDLDISLVAWKEHYQELLLVRKDIKKGLLDESSDRAYAIREKCREECREANMSLGIECLAIHEFFVPHLKKSKQTTLGRSSSTSSLGDALSEFCHSHLKFAEEVFKTALELVEEQERCQANSPATIDRYWEKGQHLLLRGRAHNNRAQAMYELAQYHEIIMPKRQQINAKSKNLFVKARKEFDCAVKRAKALRHNTVSINKHQNAKDTSAQNGVSWTVKAMIQSFDAYRLEALASGSYAACSLKLDEVEKAKERFNVFFGSADSSDMIKYADEGLAPDEIAEALDDMYWFPMRVAELSRTSLESMSSRKDLNVAAGENLVQIYLAAMIRASSISDHLLSFVSRHSLTYETERVQTKASLCKEESELCKWWETVKTKAGKKLSDVVQTARSANAMAAIPRREVEGESGRMNDGAAPLPRRIFIQDGQSLQSRSLSCRNRRLEKNVSEERRIISDKFSSEFGPNNNNTQASGNVSAPSRGKSGQGPSEYRKWGNEVLDEKDRTRCCPPLPTNYLEMGVSIEAIRALEKKLEGILPTNNRPTGHAW